MSFLSLADCAYNLSILRSEIIVASHHATAVKCGLLSRQPMIRSVSMANVILAVGPLTMVLGSLYWVLSFSKHQSKVTAEIWKQHGVNV
jgi:hypothetical protein